MWRGTLHLLEAARIHWKREAVHHRFHHVSTDEVYGTLGKTGTFHEQSAYAPRSPYAATKAASDHLVRAYASTYQLPVVLSHASNNYGPFQYPEKLVPLSILHFMEKKPVPLYGKGENVREWLYVEDHVKALDLIFHKGRPGETYHIGGGIELSNYEMLLQISEGIAQRFSRNLKDVQTLITKVTDRPGHDFRYALQCEKIKKELEWKPSTSLTEGLSKTITWYTTHTNWIKHIRSKDYQSYYQKQYTRAVH